MKRFYLERTTDASGVSGIGKVAEGCQFDTGWCALTWLTGKSAMSWYSDIETLENIHGHGGWTKVVWVDDDSSNVVITREQTGGNRSLVECGRKPIIENEVENRVVKKRRGKIVGKQ